MPEEELITLAEVRGICAKRIALADTDPERGHGTIDGLVEAVLRAVAADAPGARSMAAAAVALLDREETDRWRRWYS